MRYLLTQLALLLACPVAELEAARAQLATGTAAATAVEEDRILGFRGRSKYQIVVVFSHEYEKALRFAVLGSDDRLWCLLTRRASRRSEVPGNSSFGSPGLTVPAANGGVVRQYRSLHHALWA